MTVVGGSDRNALAKAVEHLSHDAVLAKERHRLFPVAEHQEPGFAETGDVKSFRLRNSFFFKLSDFVNLVHPEGCHPAAAFRKADRVIVVDVPYQDVRADNIPFAAMLRFLLPLRIVL